MNAIISSINTTACAAVMANAKNYDGKLIAQIPIELLQLADYQRKEGSTVKIIAQNWDNRKCDPLIVSFRDGAFYVVDGQHRMAAAKLIGKHDLTCVIYQMTYEEEADYFADQMENVRLLTVYQRLQAKAEAGYGYAKDIFDICKELGVQLTSSRRHGPGCCSAVNALVRIYNSYGHDALVSVLKAVDEIGWHYTKGGYSSSSLSSLCRLLAHVGDSEKMISVARKVVKNRSFDDVMAEAYTTYPGRGATSALSQLLVA